VVTPFRRVHISSSALIQKSPAGFAARIAQHFLPRRAARAKARLKTDLNRSDEVGWRYGQVRAGIRTGAVAGTVPEQVKLR
jgi:hypothetical protein